MTSRGKRWPETRLADSAVACRPQPAQACTTRPRSSSPSRVRWDEEQRGHEHIVATLRDQLTPGQCRRTVVRALWATPLASCLPVPPHLRPRVSLSCTTEKQGLFVRDAIARRL